MSRLETSGLRAHATGRFCIPALSAGRLVMVKSTGRSRTPAFHPHGGTPLSRAVRVGKDRALV